ncbi:MAG: metalloregulator ArsR/SmtB family transcription factor [Bacteroidota bacterium]
MKHTKVRFSSEKLQYSCNLMRALAHPLRLKILEFIDEQGETNVNRIYHTLQIEQSITSQHLKILRLAGVVLARREGKKVHYKIDYAIVTKAHKAVNRFLGKKTVPAA